MCPNDKGEEALILGSKPVWVVTTVISFIFAEEKKSRDGEGSERGLEERDRVGQRDQDGTKRVRRYLRFDEGIEYFTI